MEIIFWIVLGLLAGWIASIIMKTDAQQGPLTDIILGVLGAMVGGFVMNAFGSTGVTGFNIWSLFVAVAGAMALIWAGRFFRRAA